MAVTENNPYELLITDLSFKNNQSEDKLTSGLSLVSAVRKLQPALKIIAFSMEEREYIIRHLLDDLGVDAYVSKEREVSDCLLTVVDNIYKGKRYISAHLAHAKKRTVTPEIDHIDLEIIKLLSDGLIQNEIAANFRSLGKKITSISSVEKRITKMKASLMARNTTHLVSIAKDQGLI